MKQIKTDGDLVQVAKQIDGHLDAVRNLIEDLELAEHPQARAFIEGLDQNGLTHGLCLGRTYRASCSSPS